MKKRQNQNKINEPTAIPQTFRYTKDQESIVLNSTPAAYWPYKNTDGVILVPTMKYSRLKKNKHKTNKILLWKQNKEKERKIQPEPEKRLTNTSTKSIFAQKM